MLAALKYWRRHGISIGGALHKIEAFAEVDRRDPQQMAAAIWRFGGIFAAVELPAAAQDLSRWSGGPCALSGDWAPGTWGGHAVSIIDVAGSHSGDTYGVSTWGAITEMSEGFWQAFGVEAYVVISADWLGSDGLCPAGFDREQLLADLRALG